MNQAMHKMRSNRLCSGRSRSRGLLTLLTAAALALTVATCMAASPWHSTPALAADSTDTFDASTIPPLAEEASMIKDAETKLVDVTDAELNEIFDTKKIGVVTGVINDVYMKNVHPNSTVLQFSTYNDAFSALMAGKIDYFCLDNLKAGPYVNNTPGLYIVNRKLTPYAAHFITAKGNTELMTQINELIARYREDGTLADLEERWILNGGKDRYVMPDIPEADSDKELHVSIFANGDPIAFYQDNEYIGHSIELAKRVAYDLGNKITIEDVPFASVLAAVQTGKSDFSLDVVRTEERAEKIDFSDPYLSSPQLLMFKKETAQVGPLEKLSTGAYATFVKESRWKMILSGLQTTVLISLCAFALANLVGALLCWFTLSRHRILKRIAGVYNALIKGIPVLILLMILYYVVFGTLDVPAIFVAILAFGLFYGAMLCNVFCAGIRAVDPGEIEASTALGFTPLQTFINITLPTAANHSFDVYTDYFISLTKGTSIVGYVAIMDLTKVSDILRSQTYDAFFPLLVTAAIYFAITYLFVALFRLIKRKIDPQLKKRVVKGVIENAWQTRAVDSAEKATDKTSNDSVDEPSSDEPRVLVEAEGLTKKFGDLVVFQDVNFAISKGEIVSVIGPSGCGKSTMIRCINMLGVPTSGTVRLHGEVIPANPKPRSAEARQLCQARQRIGMVFQSYNLFSHLMVVENLMLAPVKLLGMSRQEAYDQAMVLLDSMGLASKSHVYPSELSGGQKQRVAIVRALAMRPDMILFDEPTSALDPTMVCEVTDTIKELGDNGMTMMIVTHDMDLAHDISTRVFYLDEKGIYESGSPSELFDNPKRQRTREFLHRKSGTSVTVTRGSFDPTGLHAPLMAMARHYRLGRTFENDLCLVAEEMASSILHSLAPSDDAPLEVIAYPILNSNEVQLVFQADFIGALDMCGFGDICGDVYIDDFAKRIIAAKTSKLEFEPNVIVATVPFDEN